MTFGPSLVSVAGFALQVAGIGMILYGAYRAAVDLGATERWATMVSIKLRARTLIVREWWSEKILRKRFGKVSVGGSTATMELHTAMGVGTHVDPWEGLSMDEKVERLKTQVDGLRWLVDRNNTEASRRLDGLNETIDHFSTSVDERFKGHDARDESILAWELTGGACSLLGTALAVLG